MYMMWFEQNKIKTSRKEKLYLYKSSLEMKVKSKQATTSRGFLQVFPNLIAYTFRKRLISFLYLWQKKKTKKTSSEKSKLRSYVRTKCYSFITNSLILQDFVKTFIWRCSDEPSEFNFAISSFDIHVLKHTISHFVSTFIWRASNEIHCEPFCRYLHLTRFWQNILAWFLLEHPFDEFLIIEWSQFLWPKFFSLWPFNDKSTL